MTDETTDRPDGLESEQTEDERLLTDLIGVIQREAEGLGWTTEVVQTGVPGTILGLTAPNGRDFSLMANPTP